MSEVEGLILCYYYKLKFVVVFFIGLVVWLVVGSFGDLEINVWVVFEIVVIMIVVGMIVMCCLKIFVV